MVTERYSRQTVLSHVGGAGQAKIKAARVLVVGAGGLGCPVLLYLAGAGIGHITLVDHDTVSLSNLHRQVLYTEQDVGQLKVDVACRALAMRNSTIQLTAVAKRLTTPLANRLVPDHDIIVDAGDSLALSYALSDVCSALAKPLISASVVEMAGYVGQFCATLRGESLPSYRALFPTLPAKLGSCDSLGVLGSSVGVMASLQAQMVLSSLLGQEQVFAGKLCTFDFHSLTMRKIDFSSASEPEHLKVPLLDQQDFAVDDIILELRSQAEAPELPRADALRLLPEAALHAGLPRDKRLVLCCATGLRSARLATELAKQGFTQLAIAALA